MSASSLHDSARARSRPARRTEGSALVLFSGGQDSTTCLAWALEQFAHVETIGFDYGQRHAVELDCRRDVIERMRTHFPEWSARLGGDVVIELAWLKEISETALTREVEIELDESGLPTTFVPGRNIAFFTAAAAVAFRRGHRVLIGGMCETDFSGYPDCRDDTVKALQVALNLGMDKRFVLETPLMWRDKAATWQLAHDLGGDALVELIVDATHTCYLGQRTELFAWGRGCGTCPACELRAEGYEQWQLQRAAVRT